MTALAILKISEALFLMTEFDLISFQNKSFVSYLKVK